MSVHSSGTGSAWNESLDVDQPHGLDYQEFNDLRIGIRKRISSGHSTFADNTVGGVHKPGGAAVLGMEITHQGGDVTGPIVSDGTYRGHGLVWGWDGSQDARLWCSTAVAEATTATDFTLLYLNPNKQWGGRDVTWTGDHEFDGSVDISSKLNVEGNSDFSTAIFTGPVRCDDTVTFRNPVEFDGALASVLFDGSVVLSADSTLSVIGDMSVAGTARFAGQVDLSGAVAGPQIPTAWVCFSGSAGGGGNILAQYNVNQVFRSAQGLYDISFTAAMSNTNYVVVGSCGDGDCYIVRPSAAENFTTYQRVAIVDWGGNAEDDCWVSVIFFGGV